MMTLKIARCWICALLPAVTTGVSADDVSSAWTLQPTRNVSLHSPAAVRSVMIEMNAAALHGDARQLLLQLPDGSTVLSTVERSETRGTDRVSWFGQVRDEPESDVLLTREGEHLAGYISSAAGIFEISPAPGGTVLMHHDTTRFPECGGEAHAPQSTDPAPGATRAATAGNDQPDQIDALIVFSPGAVSSLGGEAQARTYAQSAIDLSNLSYANSQMIARLRLAGVRFTTRADSGTSGTDLSWLRGDAEVADWRNEVRADLVGMVSEFSNSCGVGYLMTTNSSGFASNAFQVSARSCGIGNLTYPHEHGHNMGFAHNPENASSAVTPYAFAHWHSGQYRTVMSYSNPCVGGCTRRPYFSNPDVDFSGLPTGVENQRDNARAGDLTAPTIANFRDDLELPDAILSDGFE